MKVNPGNYTSLKEYGSEAKAKNVLPVFIIK